MTKMSKLEDLVNGVLLTRGRVREIEDLGTHFRRLVVELDRAPRIRAGDKVQFRVGAWTFRTLTPFALAADPGAMQLLVFHHTESPVGRWVRGLSAGDAVDFLGPRKSIPLAELGREVTLFGDETSVAAALALRGSGEGHQACLESDHPDETRDVLSKLGARAVTVLARSSGDDHLRELGEQLRASDRALVLTGKAQSIQALRSHLGSERRRIAKTKAYWSVGRAGLD